MVLPVPASPGSFAAWDRAPFGWVVSGKCGDGREGGGAAGRSPVRAAPQGWRGSPGGRSAAMGGLHRVAGIDRARGKCES